jgi:DNA-binding transcriptional MerR regulator
MASHDQFLNPSEAAKRLGVSTKALRLYERRGLIEPTRTEAGWRAYGPNEMDRAGEIVALRTLGLSLAQVALVLKGDPQILEAALAAHQAKLEEQLCQMSGTVEAIRALRADLTQGKTSGIAELARMVRPHPEVSVAFDLPWPWGGERFELGGIRPLGSGKTRLAQAIAETLPDAAFWGLERLTDMRGKTPMQSDESSDLKRCTDKAIRWLLEEGATASPALNTLISVLENSNSQALVIDMVEAGLDQATQEALITYLRLREAGAGPLFMTTRSRAILDLAAVGPDEKILFCPPNHSPPFQVTPYPGAPGFEAVDTCLATPEVRARTEGVIAWRPEVA